MIGAIRKDPDEGPTPVQGHSSPDLLSPDKIRTEGRHRGRVLPAAHERDDCAQERAILADCVFVEEPIVSSIEAQTSLAIVF